MKKKKKESLKKFTKRLENAFNDYLEKKNIKL